MASGYVYILGNKGGMIYVGVTNDLQKRVYQHKKKLIKGYASKYSIDRLLYYEEFNQILDAIAGEKIIKGWLRRKKLALIREMNPKFEDLSEGWYD